MDGIRQASLQAASGFPFDRRPPELGSADHRPFLKVADMLVDRRHGQTTQLRWLADRAGLKSKRPDDRAPVRVGHNVEHSGQVVLHGRDQKSTTWLNRRRTRARHVGRFERSARRSIKTSGFLQVRA